MLLRRRERFQSFMESGFYVVPFAVAFVLTNFVRAYQGVQRTDTVAACIMMAAGLLLCVAILIFGTCPRTATDRAREMAWSAIYLLVAVPAPFSMGIQQYYYFNLISLMSLMFMNTINPNPRTTLLLNGISAVWHLAAIAVIPALHNQAWNNVMVILLGYAYNLAVATSTTDLMRKEAAADVRDQEARSTLENLLRSMCDALVHLEHDLFLSQPSASLGGLLRCEPVPRGPFVDLLSDKDKSRFADFVVTSSDVESAAHVIHVDLHTPGGPLPVKVFHVCAGNYEDPEQVTHLLGLVEERRDQEVQDKIDEEEEVQQEKSFDIGEETDGRELVEWETADDEGEEVSLTVRTRLQIEIVEGSSSCERFGFNKEVGFPEILARFRRSLFTWRWLEFVHTMAACGRGQGSFDAGKVGFLDSTLEKEFRGKMRAVVLRAPDQSMADGDPEVYGKWEDFSPDMQCVHLQLKFRPPVLAADPPGGQVGQASQLLPL